jgi:hypothetical protein
VDGRRGAMSERKQRFMEDRAPRLGDQAAEYSWRLRTIRNLFWVPIVVTLASIVVPQSVHTYFLVAIAVLWIPLATAFFWTVHRVNTAATRTLGVKVAGIAEHTPPRASPRYEQWCVRNGLTPYAASDRYGDPPTAPT